VLTQEGRNGHIGSALECRACDEEAAETEGGDPACWVDRVCPECGAIVGGNNHHRTDCPLLARGGSEAN
jgi:hypothetical protein